MADFNFKVSPNIIVGSYSLSRIGQFVRDWGSRFMVVLDPDVMEFGIQNTVKQSLSDRRVDHFVYSELPPSPDSSVVQNALSLARDAHIHGIIAVGGTKALDTGKAVAALYNESNELYQYVDGAVPLSAPLPMVSVPTTMRDLFLFTDYCPIVDARSRQLKLLKTQNGLCKLTLFDSNLTAGLTENQFASFSFQILCMATECYLSQKANFFSDTIAEKAITLIRNAMDGSPALSATVPREAFLCQAGCMASLALGLSSMGPASLLSRTILARYKIPSAISSVILFPYVIDDAAKFKSDKLERVAKLLQVATETTTKDVAVTALAENMRSRLAMAKLPPRLKDLSVSIENLALAAEDAGRLELINSMPRSMNADDLFDLIKQAY